jgi:hypothetical protein
MRLTPINSAEAIFEAFFDPQLSELARWEADAAGIPGFRIWQNWIWIQWTWERPAPDGRVLRLSRRHDLDCSGYDRLIACVTLPAGATLTIRAETDLGPRARAGEPFGSVKREEWLPLEGARRIHALTLEAHFPPGTSGNGWCLWCGLQSTARLPHHLAQWKGFDAQWTGYLKPPDFEPTFTPDYGLLIGAVELEAARRDFAHSPAADGLREAAADAARVTPESLIGQHVHCWNSNTLRRERDHGQVITIHGMMAAEAGMLFKDKALCRLAARFALSLAHCERWDEFVCYMPGSAWEQRCFTQSICLHELSLILDLCGEWFTELGRELILRRIAEEGQGNVNFNTWWWEYIFHNNQVAWFTPGRMFGYVLLERALPGRRGEGFPPRARSRVRPYTDLALADLLENLGNILMPDGGYVEGASYFSWVARQAFISLHLYSRARGTPLEALMPAAMRKTAVMAEVLCSTDDNADMILTCDALYVMPDALAFLAAFMPDSHWVTIYRKQVRRAGVAPSLLAMSVAPGIPAEGPAPRPFVEMPETAMMCSVRRLGAETVKLFLMGNKGGADHAHEDKGGFVLEFAGDSFAMDFGQIDYSNPLAVDLKVAQRHNMLTPWAEGERPRPAAVIKTDLRPRGCGDETKFHATMELTPGWEGWFTHWSRAWDSPTPDTVVITDTWAVERGEGVVFHWTTPLPMRLEGGRVVIEGRRGTAVIAVPEGTEAVLDALPLTNREQRAIDEQRREYARFGLRHADQQPRLRIRQRGQTGILRIVVNLRLK